MWLGMSPWPLLSGCVTHVWPVRACFPLAAVIGSRIDTWSKGAKKQRYPSLYYFSRTLVTNCCPLAGLKQQKFILLQFWKLEIQNQDVSRALLLLKALGKNPSSPLHGIPWLVAIALQSASVFTQPSSLYICFCSVDAASPLVIRTPIIGNRAPPHPLILTQLIISARTLFPDNVYSDVWGRHEFGGTLFSPLQLSCEKCLPKP